MNGKMKKAAILLSTWNGENYLSEQIESLLAQDWNDLVICVRDDGSSDGTPALLESRRGDPRFRITLGENLGFAKSFLTLLRENGGADCYFFCDQDDVWLPDKVSRCAAALEQVDPARPALCFTGREICSEDLKRLGPAPMPSNIGFLNALADCVPMGCCMAFNAAARDLAAEHLPEHCCGHDWWLYLLCAAFGEVIPLPESGILYRRHEGNVSAGGMGFLRFQLWRFRKFFLGGYFTEITAMLREFEAVYGPRLTEEQRGQLSLFTRRRAADQWKKLTYPRPFRQSAADEIFLRLCFLLGRL